MWKFQNLNNNFGISTRPNVTSALISADFCGCRRSDDLSITVFFTFWLTYAWREPRSRSSSAAGWLIPCILIISAVNRCKSRYRVALSPAIVHALIFARITSSHGMWDRVRIRRKTASLFWQIWLYHDDAWSQSEIIVYNDCGSFPPLFFLFFRRFPIELSRPFFSPTFPSGFVCPCSLPPLDMLSFTFVLFSRSVVATAVLSFSLVFYFYTFITITSGGCIYKYKLTTALFASFFMLFPLCSFPRYPLCEMAVYFRRAYYFFFLPVSRCTLGYIERSHALRCDAISCCDKQDKKWNSASRREVCWYSVASFW